MTTRSPIIDPHVHFFYLAEGDYHWLKPENPPHWKNKNILNQRITDCNLTLGANHTLQGLVHIEAGFDNQRPWREIDHLEHNCQIRFKSVAYANLQSESFKQDIQQLLQRPSVVGVRHILDQDAASILSDPKCLAHLKYLANCGLSFDAQLNITEPDAFNALCQCAAHIPQLKLLINHGGWPPPAVSMPSYANWCQNLKKLSNYPNIAMKMSGWEMQNKQWSIADMTKTVTDALDLLGENRVMLASNFPVSNLSLPYAELWQRYQSLEQRVSPLVYRKLTNLNAITWYQFN